MLDLSTIRAFATLAELGSFSAAAATMNLNVSTVTRKLDTLEAQLSARLVDRTTRTVNLTEAGQTFLPYVTQALLLIDGGVSQIQLYQTEPAGALRVHMLPSIGRLLIAENLHHFLKRYPQLSVSMKILYSAPRLDQPDFDIAITAGLPQEERAVVRLLAKVKLGLLASSDFKKRHDNATGRDELAKLPFGAFSYDAAPPVSVANSPYNHTESTGWERLPAVSPAIACNDPEVVLRSIASGAVAGRMSYWMASEHICRGEVVPLDPSFTETVPVYAVLPSMHAIPEKTKVFLRFLEERITPELLRRENEALSYLAEQAASE
jgi:DNA-binding transcriptional LysR family regulator